MSSTNKTANYQLSQFVGTDIPSILNDYNGDMRKIDSAIHDTSVAGGDNASAIAELQSSTARMNTEIGGINSTVNTLSGKILGIEGVIPATASADNKLLTAQELPEIPSIAELEEEVSDISADVKAIQLCVPANASESNKFATHNDIPNVGIIESQISSLNSTVSNHTNRLNSIDSVDEDFEARISTLENSSATGAIKVLSMNSITNPNASSITELKNFINKYKNAMISSNYICFVNKEIATVDIMNGNRLYISIDHTPYNIWPAIAQQSGTLKSLAEIIDITVNNDGTLTNNSYCHSLTINVNSGAVTASFADESQYSMDLWMIPLVDERG